jgi:hypothetical protein
MRPAGLSLVRNEIREASGMKVDRNSPLGYRDATRINMWLFTNIGFFSVVQKPKTNFLTIRARVGSDLDNLREKYMALLSSSTEKGGSDYPHRATISHVDFAAGLAKMGQDIHYDNFKNEVARKMGHKRSHVYHKVWQDLLELESSED